MTGRIIIDLFTTLDWVAQAPGAPDEDTSGGFPFGGWQAPLPSEAVGRRVEEGMKSLDALLLGRRTYDIFAGYWPHHTTGPEGFIGRLSDRVPKCVASRNRDLQPGWQGSTRIGDDLVAEVDGLRRPASAIAIRLSPHLPDQPLRGGAERSKQSIRALTGTS